MTKQKKTRRSAKPYDKQALEDSRDTKPLVESPVMHPPGPSDANPTEPSNVLYPEPSTLPYVEAFATPPFESFDVPPAETLTISPVEQSIMSSTEPSPGPSVIFTSAPTSDDPSILGDPLMQTYDNAIPNDAASNKLPVVLSAPKLQPLNLDEFYARYPLLTSFSAQMVREIYLKDMGPKHMAGIAHIRDQLNRLPYPLGCIAAIERTDFTMPTHILGVQSQCAMNMNPAHNFFMCLTPVHDFVLHLTCPNIPNLPPSNRIDYMQIVPIAVPCPEMLPKLLEYLTLRCTGAITNSCLDSNDIYGIYWNAYVLGVQDPELYSLLDRLFLSGGTQLHLEKHALSQMSAVMKASWDIAQMSILFQLSDHPQGNTDTDTSNAVGMVVDDAFDNTGIIMDATLFADAEAMDAGPFISTV